MENYVLLLTSIEVSLGSLLHLFHIPFSGQVLSLNQIFILSHAYKRLSEVPQLLGGKETSTAVYALVNEEQGYSLNSDAANNAKEALQTASKSQVKLWPISFQAAIFKLSLSPGKKLTPFIAIFMQGLLFSIGSSIAGAYLGAALASMWAFIQPLLLLSFFTMGHTKVFFEFYQNLSLKIGFSLYSIILTCVIFKIALSFILVFLASKADILEKYKAYFLRTSQMLRIKKSRRMLGFSFFLIILSQWVVFGTGIVFYQSCVRTILVMLLYAFLSKYLKNFLLSRFGKFYDSSLIK